MHVHLHLLSLLLTSHTLDQRGISKHSLSESRLYCPDPLQPLDVITMNKGKITWLIHLNPSHHEAQVKSRYKRHLEGLDTVCLLPPLLALTTTLNRHRAQLRLISKAAISVTDAPR
jgi:hypothetical protein